MHIPYISITDFTYYRQVQKMLFIAEKFNNGKPDEKKCKLGVGVMMSYKTLHGLDTKFSKVFPANEAIADIFINHSLAFNTLHYAFYIYHFSSFVIRNS